jgi:hypothetical protein
VERGTRFFGSYFATPLADRDPNINLIDGLTAWPVFGIVHAMTLGIVGII